MAYVVERSLSKRGSSEENNSLVSCTNWQKKTSDGTNDVYINTTYNLWAVKDERYFIGYDVPSYHKRVKSGELMPHTPWRQTVINGESTGSYSLNLSDGLTHYSKGNFCNFTEWIITEEELAALAPPTVQTDLAQEAAAKLYTSGHDTLTFIAELTDVRRMFLSAGKSLLKLQLPKGWRAYNSQWLSARYGWRTLVYDIKQMSQAIASLDRVRKRSSEKARSKSSNVSNTAWEHEHAHYYTDISVFDVVDVEFVGSVVADIEVPKFQFNPLLTGWEIIPFSFVMDWFVSTGKALAALCFLTMQTNYAASSGYAVTMTRVFTQAISRYKSTCYGGWKDQIGTCTGRVERREPCRVPLIPHLNVRLNALKIVDLMALILQRI